MQHEAAMFNRGGLRWRRAGVAGSVCVVILAIGVTVASSKPPAARQVHPGFFSAYIDHGPDSGLAVWGALSGTIASSGRIAGTLKGDHPPVRITGQATGRSAKLVFHLPGGRAITGVGTAPTTIHDVASLPGNGRFSGPRRGDSGVWDQVRCEKYGRPGLKEEENQYKCVTSEGKVFIVQLPPLKA